MRRGTSSLNATDAPYTILDGVGGNVLATATIDQTAAADEFTAAGTSWETLATVIITGNTIVLELTDNTNGRVFADAVRIERFGDVP